MEAVTDVVFRHVVEQAAPPDVYFSEFTNATGWVHAGQKAIGGRLVKTPDETRLVAQIWGGEPGDMEQLAAHCRELGFIGIDINMGCPAKSAVKSGGSALIRNPALAAQAIAAAKTAGLPVSVKTRLGYTNVSEWRDWLAHLLAQDIANLTIHLRTKKEMSKVPAHFELIPEIVVLRDQIAPHTLLTINGDIRDRSRGHELVHQFPGVNGVMIGRGVFHDPFCFATTPARVASGGAAPAFDKIAGDFSKEGADRTTGPETSDLRGNSAGIGDDGSGRKQALLDLLYYHLDQYDRYHTQTNRPFETLKRFFKIYIRDFDGASALRAALMLTESTNEARQLLRNHQLATTPKARYDKPMNPTIKAIVFDSDGTLLDTRQLIFEGYKTVLRNHNLLHLANDQYIRQRLGKPTEQTFEQIISGHNVAVSARELASELDSVQDSMTDLIKPYPHTIELLEAWKDRGVKLCLFTSGYGYMIERNYTAAGIGHYNQLFDAIISADDQLPHKPEPQAIDELLGRVGVEPGDAVVVGDHAYDIISGARARVGLKIGILHGIGTQHELLTAGADFLCDSLESLNHLMSFAKR